MPKTTKKAEKRIWKRTRPQMAVTLGIATHRRLGELAQRMDLSPSRVIDEAVRLLAAREGVR
jgi:predicted transcriptional regulator